MLDVKQVIIKGSYWQKRLSYRLLENSPQQKSPSQRSPNDFPNSFDVLQKQWMITTKTKAKAPTTVILGDSIVKKVYGNAIIKSVKHKKQKA